MEPIRSLQNSRVKAAARLRDRRARKEQGRFLIDGARELQRAVQANIPLDEVFVCREQCRSPAAQSLLARLEAADAPLVAVSASVLEKIAFGNRSEGLVAAARAPSSKLAEFELPQNALLVVLEGVEKPGNVGAVLRTAAAAGASGVLVADGGTDLYNPNAVRASQGAIFSVPLFEASSADLRQWLLDRGIQIISAQVDGAASFWRADFTPPTALVLGSEAEGLSPLWRKPPAKSVVLPMAGTVDSLNVSITAAVLLYEAARQRGG